MRVRIILLIGVSALLLKYTAQTEGRHNINLHLGSLAVYNTFSIGYEYHDLMNAIDKHQLKPVIRGGGWGASIINKNKGVQTSLGLSYLYGRKHMLEFASEYVVHFDKGLKGQSITYIAATYRPFLGYRYEGEKKMIFRIGAGWKEVVQFGVGYKL